MVSAYMMLNYHISNSKTIYVSNSTEGNMLCSWSGFLSFCLWNFQEYWCKRLHPKNVCEKVYRQPPLRDSLKKGKLRRQDFSVTKQKTALLLAADSIGKKIQYDCPGFLSNRRQVIYLEYCSRMKIFLLLRLLLLIFVYPLFFPILYVFHFDIPISYKTIFSRKACFIKHVAFTSQPVKKSKKICLSRYTQWLWTFV